MDKINNILLVNMLVLLVSLVVVNVAITESGEYAGLAVMVVTMLMVFGQAAANLIIAIVSFVMKEKARGLNFLLATLVVLLAGCFGCFVSGGIK